MRKRVKFKNRTFYHVYNRGHRKGKLYKKKKDYEYFVNLLFKYAQRYDVVLVAYCLMPNHFHFVLWLGESKTDITKFMHGLKTSYAQYFNRKYNYVGSPYQGRYEAREVESEDELCSILDYIKYNPVEAGLVLHYEDYPWFYIKRKYIKEKKSYAD